MISEEDMPKWEEWIRERVKEAHPEFADIPDEMWPRLRFGLETPEQPRTAEQEHGRVIAGEILAGFLSLGTKKEPDQARVVFPNWPG